MMRPISAFAALALLAGCDSPGGESNAGDTASAAPVRPAAFQQCAVCHSDQKDARDWTGPNLFGVVGSTAGTHRPGYAYSSAMRGAKFKWDRARLDAWLEDPARVVPGNRMYFYGVKDAARRAEIIDYLEKLR